MFVLAGGHYGAYYTGHDYLRAAAERGIEAVVVTADDGTIAQTARGCGFPVQVLPVHGHSYDIGKIWGLARSMRKHAPDVVHTHLAFPSSAIVHLAGALARVPVLDHAGMEFVVWHSNRLVGLYQRMLLRLTSRFRGMTVAMSHRVKETLVTAGVGPDRIRVIHHGVDSDAISQATVVPKEVDELIDGRLPVACVGHLSIDKRQIDAIEAFERVIDKCPEASLLLIGSDRMTHYEPGYAAVLQDRVKDLGLERHVFFLGHIARESVWAVLKRCIAFVHPSANEGFGIAVPEAMAAGIPVVVSRTGALPEIVRDSVDGYVVPVGDVSDIADKLSIVLSDPERARAMGRAAQERVREHFDIRKSQDAVFDAMYSLARSF